MVFATETKIYSQYVEIMRQELVPALGYTEPIAIAFTAAKAKDVLGMLPDHMIIACSGNIIKNVKGTVVPNSEGTKGIEAAAALGATGGGHFMRLEALTFVTAGQIEQAKTYIAEKRCVVKLLPDSEQLHILISAY